MIILKYTALSADSVFTLISFLRLSYVHLFNSGEVTPGETGLAISAR